MRRRGALPGALVLALATACGGDKSSTESTQPANLVTNGSFSATINGTAWSAIGRVAVNKTSTTNDPLVAIAAGSTTYTISSFGIGPVTGPGTFSLNFQQPAVAVIQAATGQGWTTAVPGGTGTITITTYSANRIAGTFSFDAVPFTGGATGVVHVTNGAFDITF